MRKEISTEARREKKMEDGRHEKDKPSMQKPTAHVSQTSVVWRMCTRDEGMEDIIKRF
jgi:hypothetical protein